MKVRSETLLLPEGDKLAEVLVYTQSDVPSLINIYESWRNLCDNLDNLGSRMVNLPEGLSEVSFAIAKNMWRKKGNITGVNSSFDCYDPNGGRHNNRIQVKACSVIPDLTSFGPKSKWDRIFFVDFYRQGLWDKTFDVYEIRTIDVENFPVNETQTLKDQKEQGRRPRFSIYTGLIEKGQYISKETYKLTEEGIVKI